MSVPVRFAAAAVALALTLAAVSQSARKTLVTQAGVDQITREAVLIDTLCGACSAALLAPSQSVAVETAVIHSTAPGATNWRMEFSHGRMRIENRNVRDLVRAAYGLSANSQVINAPPWVLNRSFDISGTFDPAESKNIDMGTAEQRSAVIADLLRGLLADRFRLKAHESQVLLPVYALTISRHGLKAQPSSPTSESPFHGIVGPAGKLEGRGVSMALLASRLTSMRDADERLVVDETGVSGVFDWSLRWNAAPISEGEHAGEIDLPSMFTALEEQLGLKLISKRSTVPAVVIDWINQPSDN